jgi:hypothetical protein
MTHPLTASLAREHRLDLQRSAGCCTITGEHARRFRGSLLLRPRARLSAARRRG